MMDEYIPAIKVRQNDKKILVFSMKASDLIKISYFNPREFDREEGIQRDFKPIRSKNIANYIDLEDSSLPNNIIVNLELSKNKSSLSDIFGKNKLNLNRLFEISKSANPNVEELKEKIAFIIDGQHRLRAFSFTSKVDFPLIVSAYVDLSLAEVAELFVKINYNQVRVNKSIVFDLLGISEKIFPEYFVHHKVVKKLNEDISSPFYSMVKMLGSGKGTISQASIITAIEKYKLEKTLIKHGFDIEEDILYDVIWHFFTAVSEVFEMFWGEGRILSKSVGTRALFKLLTTVLDSCLDDEEEFSSDKISEFLFLIDKSIFSANETFNYVGEKGVTLFYNKMHQFIFED
ncbi:MAG: DGQHR domain-containing protein [Desulfobacterales bacterium]|nr:DGQHR domain-containing protein [Desulfobacterales bacterium]